MLRLNRPSYSASTTLGLLISVVLASNAVADEPGFTPLFNGKDLTGWRQGETDLAGKIITNDGRFSVKDGVLVIGGSTETPPRMTEIDTVKSFDGDFTLRLEFRASQDANSGLHLRDKQFKHQLQIRDYPRVGPYKSLKTYKAGDWNAVEVVVHGTGARCTCNGELLEASLEIPDKGRLALQSELNTVEYRNIRIKTEETATNPARLPGGVLPARAGEPDRPLMAYVGTFSSPLKNVLPTQVDLPPGNGRGIHLFQVDRSTGALTPAGVVEMGISPSCLVLNQAGTRLYSANETDRIGQDKEGSVSSFAVNRENGKLESLNTIRTGGAGPTYVSVHPSGKFLLVANYFGGSISVLPILEDGRLGRVSDLKKDSGTLGPATAAGAPPGSFAFSGHDRTHAHMIQADPGGKFALHVDLALDRIFTWKFHATRGLLTANEPHSITLPPGDGPRHFSFHPNGRWLYSIQEEASTIVLFDYDDQKGQLTPRQTISTLPPGFAGSNFCSEILVSGDGRFVYAGNRLHDSVGIFSVGPNGELTYVGEEWTHGDYPRSFSFGPTGEFFYCCNQRGDNVAVFKVDRKTGGLTFTGHYAPVGNPSSIVFQDMAKMR